MLKFQVLQKKVSHTTSHYDDYMQHTTVGIHDSF